MKILRALGFGLALIILRFLMPDIFLALEKTLLLFFDVLQTGLSVGKNSMSAGVLLPQLPQLPSM